MDTGFWIFMCLVCLACGGGVGSALGECVGKEKKEKEAVERGFAQYNSKTGNWEWLASPSGR